LGAGALAACDAGTFRIDPATQPAFPLVMLGANVGENKPMPLDGAVQLSFSRYLMPSNVTRQAFVLTAVGGGSVPPPIVAYDPVARTVTLQNPSPGQPWLAQDQVYKLDMKPETVLAIDGGKLEGPTSLTFRVGPPSGTPYAEPKVSLCTDILPIFSAKCLGGGCHSGKNAAASLVLETSTGVKVTAVGRVAQAANTGGRAAPSAPGKVFGVNMPLIDPGNPSNSWLLYKVLLAQPPTTTTTVPYYACTATLEAKKAGPYTPIAPYSEAPAQAESDVLGGLVLGREMPFPVANPSGYEELPLTFQERQAIRLWIAQGAEVTECGGCGPTDPPGTRKPDAGPADAGTD